MSVKAALNTKQFHLEGRMFAERKSEMEGSEIMKAQRAAEFMYTKTICKRKETSGYILSNSNKLLNPTVNKLSSLIYFKYFVCS